MAKMEMQIEIKDLEPVKSLIKVLAKKYDDLPNELQEALRVVMDRDAMDYTSDDFEKDTKDINGEVTTSLIDVKIIKVNKHSKKVYLMDGTVQEHEHFWIRKGKKIIYEW